MRSPLVNPLSVTWRVTNLETNADVSLASLGFKDASELRYTYTIPFFDHQIHCSVNQRELNQSPLIVRLLSVAEKMPCSYCDNAAVQAYVYLGIPANNQRLLKSFGKVYGGACSRHISRIEAPKWNLTPQKCNSSRSDLKRPASALNCSGVKQSTLVRKRPASAL
jgi:uncharacterized Zn-finger protein